MVSLSASDGPIAVKFGVFVVSQNTTSAYFAETTTCVESGAAAYMPRSIIESKGVKYFVLSAR